MNTEHISTIMMMYFDGATLEAFGKNINCTCIVRNDENKRRKGPDDVLFERGGHIVGHDDGGRPYQPRRFPKGSWEITDVIWPELNSVYWPVILKTEANQPLQYWKLDNQGRYKEPAGDTFNGYGYWIHHARYRHNGELIDSSTTYGCLNVLSVEDMIWLGEKVHEARGFRQRVFVNVPPWSEWKV